MARDRAGLRHRAGVAVAMGLSLLGGACSPLRLFNAVMPKDGGSVLAVSGAAYGAGERRKLDIYLPSPLPGPRPVAGSAGVPVIVFFYGGSWNGGERQGYGFVGRALAARGFLVAIPDYRLVPEVHYPAFLEDSAAAVRWVRAHAAELGGDPGRVILAGHSAGAYNAAMLAFDPRWLGADRQAVRGFIGLAGPYDFLPFSGDIVRDTFVDVGNEAATQPVCHVALGDPPSFIANGDKDDVVLPRNSAALAAALAKAGVPVERRTYAKVGHAGLVVAVAVPFRGRASVLDDMMRFAAGVTAVDGAVLPSDTIKPAAIVSDCGGH